MKSLMMMGMLCILWGWAGAQAEAGYVLIPVGAQPVAVSFHRVTALVFPSAVRSGVRVTRDVQVEKVRGVENVLAIRAARGRFVATNLAVFGMDGRIYSFNLEYSDTATAWQWRVEPNGDAARGLILTGLPADEDKLREDARILKTNRGWMNAAVKIQKMRLAVTGIYYADSLLWLAGKLRNRSVPDFAVQRVRLFTEDRRRVKRMAVQEAEMDPVYTDWDGAGLVAGETIRGFALAYRGIAVPQGKRLVLEVAEREGGRTIRLRIPLKKILAARKLRIKNR
jgi:hypothetical protein